MGIWAILAVLVVVAFVIKGGHYVYHTRKARKSGSAKQTPTH